MKTFIVLLRGINVSGQKSIKMAHLRNLLQKLGFQNVATYIQSGNIILSTHHLDAEEIEERIAGKIQERFGFEVPVLVKSIVDFERIVQKNPFSNAQNFETLRIYYILLKDSPRQVLVDNLKSETYPNEQFAITQDCVYLACLKGYGNTKLDNNLLERKLKVKATTRSHRTMVRLLEMGLLRK